MYCHQCGKNNLKGSKFCQHCGIKLNEHRAEASSPAEHKSSDELINADKPPYPYVISVSKLVIMSISTFGIYDLYWFYKHFKSFKSNNDWKITPWTRALFATLTSYSLFKQVSRAVSSIDKTRSLEAGGLAIAYFLLAILYKLPEPYWWLSFLSVLPLISVQNTINFYWEKKYGEKVIQSGFGTWNYIWSIMGGIFVLLALIGTFGKSN